MKIKDYFLSCGLAMVTAAVTIFILWLFSLISWGIVWAVLSFGLVPLMNRAIQFYRENRCMDIQDFFIEVFKLINKEDKEEKNSSIEW